MAPADQPGGARADPSASATGGGERPGDELRAIRDKFTMACPDKPHTPWAVLTRAADRLDALSEAGRLLDLAFSDGEDAPVPDEIIAGAFGDDMLEALTKLRAALSERPS